MAAPGVSNIAAGPRTPPASARAWERVRQGAGRFETAGDTGGEGLMMGIELVVDEGTTRARAGTPAELGLM
jgi:4-aminobutyrate aminotransferase-like enzyme